MTKSHDAGGGGLALTVLLYEGAPDLWIAQVLERNMVAHGPSPDEAFNAVKAVLQARVNFDTRHKQEPLATLKPAPDVYWKARECAEPFRRDRDSDPFLPAHVKAVVTKRRVSID